MKPYRHVATVVAAAWTLAACGRPSVEPTLTLTPVAAAARAPIEAAMQRYNRFMRAGPPDSAAALFTEDGELFEPRDAVLKGRNAIRDFLQPLGEKLRVESASSTTQSLEAWGATALEWGEYVQNVGPAGGASTTYRGRFVAEWLKQADGRWLLRRLMMQPLTNR